MILTRSEIRILQPYLPFRTLEKIFTKKGHPFRPIEPLRGAILFVDVKGFTPLTSSLARVKPKGIEILRELLSTYFIELIRVIREYGGIVYQFAGDSILVGFSRSERETDGQCALRTINCALAAQERLSQFYEQEILPKKKFSILTKMGVGYGVYHELLLGGIDTWYRHAIVGRSCDSAIAAENLALGGDIVVSPDIWELLPGGKTGEKIRDNYVIDSLPGSAILHPEEFGFIIPEEEFDEDQQKNYCLYINPPLLKNLLKDVQGFDGDYREVTAVFIRFDSLHFESDPRTAANQLNQFYKIAQQETESYGGILLHVDVTDKGNVFFILFGAPTAQENKEILATQLSMKIIKIKQQFPFIKTVRVGIATGITYCGDIGAPFRKTYTALGETVNLAARLMSFNQKSAIYVDQRTELKLRKSFVREKKDNVRLKGVEKEQTIYEVTSEIQRFRGILISYKTEMVGRTQELNQLLEILRKSCDEEGQICALVGEAGIGKSRLSAALLDKLKHYNAEPLVGYSYSYEKYTPFFLWKEVLLNFFQIFEFDPLQLKLEKIKNEFTVLQDVSSEWILVLAKIMGIQVEEEELTRNLEARQKNQRIYQIIFQLLEKRSMSTPLLLFFDDYHWADELSKNLIEYIAARLTTIPAMILLVMRPHGDVEKIAQLAHFELIELKELGEDDVRHFLTTKLNLVSPNRPFENLILAKSQGNPFFIEEIVQSLIDQSWLRKSENDRYKLAVGINEISIPHSLQDVLLTRIDKLQVKDQVILKTASVIGRIFQYKTLAALCPEEIKVDLEESLQELQQLDLTPLETEEPLTYMFKHIAIRDVAYNTLLIATREDIHRRLANYLEQNSQTNIADAADILAYHYLAGNDEVKGLRYTLIAARKARDQYANENAVHHFLKALEMLDKPQFKNRKDDLFQVKFELAEVYSLAGYYEVAIELFEECLSYQKTNLERADIHFGLGKVYQEKAEPLRAVKELETALKLFGLEVPQGKIRLVFSLLIQLCIQLIHAHLPWSIRQVPKQKETIYQKQSSILFVLHRIYFFVDIEKLAWLIMAHINLTDRIKNVFDSSMASLHYAIFWMCLGFMKRASRYFAKGVELAHQTKNPMAEALAQWRWGFSGLYLNEPSLSIEKERRAIAIFKQIGEMWELQTALSIEATAYSYSSDFEKCKQKYREMGEISKELGSEMHQSWNLSFCAFFDYLQGRIGCEEAVTSIKRAYQIALKVDDLSCQCFSLRYLALISIRENQPENAAQLAVNAYHTVKKYKIVLPHAQMAFIDAADAALFALHSKAQTVPSKTLLKIARKGSKKGVKLGKTFPYLLGPGFRVRAQFLAYTKGTKNAEPLFERAVKVLEEGPNKWETGVAYLQAGLAIPRLQETNFRKAQALFEELGLEVELARIPPRDTSTENMQPTPSSSARS